MLISVIIPVYNRESFIFKAVESVLNQSYANLELLIIDDCSSDDTYFSVSNLLYDKRLTYYFLNRNTGVSYARNFGILHSKGDYLAFLDSDDWWIENKLEKQLNFMLENGYEISQTDEFWLRKNKFVNPKKKHKKIAGNIFEKSLELCLVSPSAVMVKRELFEKIGMFDESLPACEDYDLWLRVSLSYEVGLLSEKLVVKRGGHDDQLSRMSGLDKYRIHSLLKILNDYRLDNNGRGKVKKILKDKLKIYINGSEKRKKFEEANYYREILKNI